MKSILITSLIFLCIIGRKAIAQDSENERYLTAIEFLKSDLSMNSTIQRIYKRRAKKVKGIVQININDRIEYIKLGRLKDFFDTKIPKQIKDTVVSWRVFDSQNTFKSYYSNVFGEIKPIKKTPLYLTFSRPIGNFLVGEVLEYDPKIYGPGAMRFGRVIIFLFLFNDKGTIDRVYNRAYYAN